MNNVEKKGILVIKTDQTLSFEHHERIRAMAEPLCDSLGLKCLVLDSGLTAGVHYDLTPLIAAIQAQTEAINALAASNCELIQAMAQAEDLPTESKRYLDGSKT